MTTNMHPGRACVCACVCTRLHECRSRSATLARMFIDLVVPAPLPVHRILTATQAWPYFDYLENTHTIAEFLPDSDFSFRDFRERLLAEYAMALARKG